MTNPANAYTVLTASVWWCRKTVRGWARRGRFGIGYWRGWWGKEAMSCRV